MTKRISYDDNNSDDEQRVPRYNGRSIADEMLEDNFIHALMEFKIDAKDYIDRYAYPLMQRFDFAEWDDIFEYMT